MNGLKVGDSVTVKQGVTDPDLGMEISGWQGRILDVQVGESGEILVNIQWDSVTLKHMTDSLIVQCEEQGWDWAEMVLGIGDIEPAESRDTQTDVIRMKQKLSDKFAWSHLGEEGRRIRQVLIDVDDDDEMGMLDAWEGYLEQKLTFPFEAEVYERQDKGPLNPGDRVTAIGISLVNDSYGVIVDLRRGRSRYAFPLCDLTVVDERSSNYQVVSDYRVWFANR